ncbi:MAG: type II secretion system F family protein, partial [Calditrichia bacterium]
MPKFKYKAVSPEGDILEDQIAAADKIAVVQHLKNLNLAAIEISRDEVKHSKNLSRKKLKVKHVLLFTMQLHTLLKAGISIVHSLNVIKEQNADPLFNYVLEDISHKVQQGNSLSEALGYYPKIFPSIFVNSIKVGELSGTLEEALVNLYQYIEEDDRMRKEVKKALRYPLIVLLAMIGAFLVFTLLVIPNFMPLFEMHS